MSQLLLSGEIKNLQKLPKSASGSGMTSIVSGSGIAIIASIASVSNIRPAVGRASSSKSIGTKGSSEFSTLFKGSRAKAALQRSGGNQGGATGNRATPAASSIAQARGVVGSAPIGTVRAGASAVVDSAQPATPEGQQALKEQLSLQILAIQTTAIQSLYALLQLAITHHMQYPSFIVPTTIVEWIEWVQKILCLNSSATSFVLYDLDMTVLHMVRVRGLICDELIHGIADLTALSSGIVISGAREGGGSGDSTAASHKDHVLSAIGLLETLVHRALNTSKTDDMQACVVHDSTIVPKLLNLAKLRYRARGQFHSYFDTSMECNAGRNSSVGGAGRWMMKSSIPTLVYKPVMWRVYALIYLLGCSRPDSIGLTMWTYWPSLKLLLVMSISGQLVRNSKMVASFNNADTSSYTTLQNSTHLWRHTNGTTIDITPLEPVSTVSTVPHHPPTPTPTPTIPQDHKLTVLYNADIDTASVQAAVGDLEAALWAYLFGPSPVRINSGGDGMRTRSRRSMKSHRRDKEKEEKEQRDLLEQRLEKRVLEEKKEKERFSRAARASNRANRGQAHTADQAPTLLDTDSSSFATAVKRAVTASCDALQPFQSVIGGIWGTGGIGDIGGVAKRPRYDEPIQPVAMNLTESTSTSDPLMMLASIAGIEIERDVTEINASCPSAVVAYTGEDAPHAAGSIRGEEEWGGGEEAHTTVCAAAAAAAGGGVEDVQVYEEPVESLFEIPKLSPTAPEGYFTQYGAITTAADVGIMHMTNMPQVHL